MVILRMRLKRTATFMGIRNHLDLWNCSYYINSENINSGIEIKIIKFQNQLLPC